MDRFRSLPIARSAVLLGRTASLAWLIGLLVVFVPLALWAFRRA